MGFSTATTYKSVEYQWNKFCQKTDYYVLHETWDTSNDYYHYYPHRNFIMDLNFISVDNV